MMFYIHINCVRSRSRFAIFIFYSYYDSNKLIRGKNAGYFSRSVSVAVMVWLNMICTTKQSTKYIEKYRNIANIPQNE